MRTRKKIAITGAGIAGSLIAEGLRHEADLEIICLERVGPDDHAEAGTGLNLGPNAMKSLAAFMPASATAIVGNALPWRRWTVALTDGETLMDLDLASVADNPGVRIRWAELYALLRAPITAHVLFGTEVLGWAPQDDRRLALTYRPHGETQTRSIADIDLLIGADGRYSAVRQQMMGPDEPLFLGVCLYRASGCHEDRRGLAGRLPARFERAVA